MFDITDIVNSNSETALQIARGYQQLWDSIYTNQNELWNVSMYLAELVASFSYISGSLALAKSLLGQRYLISFKQLSWFVIVGILLSLNGYYLANGTAALNDFSVDVTRRIYDIRINSVALGTSVKDAIVTQEMRAEIKRLIAHCIDAETTMPDLECSQKVIEENRQQIIEKSREEIEGQKRLEKLEERKRNPLELGKTLIVGTAAHGTIFGLLKGFQWGYSQCVELGQIITGLYGPIAVALSLYELPFKPVYSWLLGYMTIAIVNWSYAGLVGLICWVMEIQGFQSVSDWGFIIFLCLLAPGISTYLAKAGGAAIYEHFIQGGRTILKAAVAGGKLLL